MPITSVSELEAAKPPSDLIRIFTFLSITVFGVGLACANEHHHQGMESHWMAPAKAAKKRNPVKATPASLSRAEELYQSHCAICHGTNGQGDGPSAADLHPRPANLKESSVHHSDGDLAWKITHGRGSMPGWKGTLKPNQIWDLVNYIRRLGGS